LAVIFHSNAPATIRRTREESTYPESVVSVPFDAAPGVGEQTMTQTYRTLRLVRSDEGVLGVVIDAPPMNLIGPELGELESDEDVRVMVLESADPEYFVPHVDLIKVAEYTAEAARRAGRTTHRWACCGTSSVSCRS
jgi:hypothetical protein